MTQDVRDMSDREVRELVDRQSSAIQRARGILERGGPIKDAISILAIACPRLTARDSK